MCESCVDRLFSQGPAVCPVSGCRRTLRKQRFRRQTFEDLRIEREVDIRRRIAAVFNRRQDEFETLRAYNDYLENVENLTFNLIYDVDVKETEAKLAAYAAQNRVVIARNTALEQVEHNSVEAQVAARKQQTQLHRQESIREEEADRQAKEEAEREAQDQIAKGQTNASAAVLGLKKSTARRRAYDRTAEEERDENGAPPPLFEIQGLKPVVAAEAPVAYDAFGGLMFQTRYYQPQEHYEHPWLDAARKDPTMSTGGFNVGAYTARAMLEAFAGLGVFVGDGT